MDPSNSPYIQYLHSELLVETFSVLWCVIMQCFASNMLFFKTNSYLVISHIGCRIIVLSLGNVLMCNLYVFDRVLGMSSFTHVLVSIDIHVMLAVKHLIKRIILRDMNFLIVVSAHFAAMCATRLSL